MHARESVAVVFPLAPADYGVPTLRCVQERRKSCEAGLATRGGRSETALKIYMPPEVRQSFPSSPPTAATDVYRYVGRCCSGYRLLDNSTTTAPSPSA